MDRLPDLERVRSTIDTFSPKVGAVLLQHWEFGEETIEVARSRDDWWRNPGPEADLADVVLLARLHASFGNGALQELPLINEVPAFFKLPLGDLGPDASLQFLRDAESDVQDLMRMLGV